MHFTPAPGRLHPRETQPCPGSSCARCPRHGTHRNPGPAPPPPRSRETPRGEGGAGAGPPPQAPKTQGGGGLSSFTIPAETWRGSLAASDRGETRHGNVTWPLSPLRGAHRARGSLQAAVLPLTWVTHPQVHPAPHKPQQQFIPRKGYFGFYHHPTSCYSPRAARRANPHARHERAGCPRRSFACSQHLLPPPEPRAANGHGDSRSRGLKNCSGILGEESC